MTDGLQLDPIDDVLEEFRRGKMVILVDDADRENEGDVVVATEQVTPEQVAFMMHEVRGLICVSISVEDATRLDLPYQTESNQSAFNTPFTVSVDHRDFAGRGITAASRAHTMRRLITHDSKAAEFISPGYVFPLRANPIGVLGRRGQTEGSYDLARLTGYRPSGVVCEILNSDGTMARGKRLQQFARRYGLLISSVEEILRYRVRHESFLRQTASVDLQTDFGVFHTRVFEDELSKKEHLALIYGNLLRFGKEDKVLVRIHSECLTGDVFQSTRCDCGEQLHQAMRRVVAEGAGVILYLRQEGRGIGLLNKIQAYGLQDSGKDTVEANECLGFRPDERDFAVAANILHEIGVGSVRLLTNNPQKLSTMVQREISVKERIPILIPENEHNSRYLKTKREKMGHLL